VLSILGKSDQVEEAALKGVWYPKVCELPVLAKAVEEGNSLGTAVTERDFLAPPNKINLNSSQMSEKR
jgi:hypothetical protein